MQESVEEALGAITVRFLRASEDGTLLCAEDLLPLLQHPAFSDIDTLVLAVKRNARMIVPSLCVARAAGKEPLVLRKIETLHSFCPSDGDESGGVSLRRVDDALQAAASSGYEVRLQHGTSVILTRGVSVLSDDTFRQLAFLSGLLRESSLNLLNDSLDIRDHEAHELKLSASLDDTVDAVARFAEAHYFVEARVLRDDYGKGQWVEVASTVDSVVVKRIVDTLGSDSLPTKPTLVRDGTQYSLLFPVVRRGRRLDDDEIPIGTKRERRFRHVLVLTSSSPIRRYVVTNLLFHFQRYFDHHVQGEQQRCLAELREYAAELAAEVRYPHRPSDFKYLEVYRTYVTRALKQTCELTTAFSASCRLYNPVNDSLEQIALYEDPSVIPHQEPLWDHLQLTQGGVNARAFESDAPYVYLEDLSPLRTRLQRRKEQREKQARRIAERPEFLDRRAHAQSELCVPLFYKKTKIGVINLESPLRDGLRSDITFICDVVRALEQLLVALLDSNDQRWLYSRDRHQQSFHELMNLVQDEAFPAPLRERFNRQIDVLRGVNISEGGQRVALTDLEAFKARYVEAVRPLGIAEDLAYGCRIHINEKETRVRRYWLGCVETIYRNLLDNLRAHADPSKDTVVIDQPAPRAPRHIKLQTKSSTRFDESDLDTLLITPMAGSDRLHYGLFVVGAIARHLGGYAYVGNVPDGGGMVIVTVPLDDPDAPQEIS